MHSTKQTYQVPTLKLSGDVVTATRAADTGVTEPNLPFRPKEIAGSIGFGL